MLATQHSQAASLSKLHRRICRHNYSKLVVVIRTHEAQILLAQLDAVDKLSAGLYQIVLEPLPRVLVSANCPSTDVPRNHLLCNINVQAARHRCSHVNFGIPPLPSISARAADQNLGVSSKQRRALRRSYIQASAGHGHTIFTYFLFFHNFYYGLYYVSDNMHHGLGFHFIRS